VSVNRWKGEKKEEERKKKKKKKKPRSSRVRDCLWRLPLENRARAFALVELVHSVFFHPKKCKK
jgi:hypothetical protein